MRRRRRRKLELSWILGVVAFVIVKASQADVATAGEASEVLRTHVAQQVIRRLGRCLAARQQLASFVVEQVDRRLVLLPFRAPQPLGFLRVQGAFPIVCCSFHSGTKKLSEFAT